MSEAMQEQQSAEAGFSDQNEFLDLLKKECKPRTDEKKQAIDLAATTLAQVALEQTVTVSNNTVKTVETLIAQLDKKLSEQVNKILHHPEFQELEGAWRGLHHLVNNTETDEQLKIRVMDVSKKDLSKTLMKFKGAAWDQSPIFKQLYEHEYGQFGGEPYGCLVGDYYFNHDAPDVAMLGEIAKISSAIHAPFLSAADPSLMGMDSYQELSNPRDLKKIFGTAEHAAWKSLRQSDDAKYLALTMPRFLSRLPYGERTNPVEGFAFEEDTDGSDHEGYTWANSAYAFAVNVNRSFKEFGWCSRIRGIMAGGEVEGLPSHTFPSDDGGVEQKCPTEIAISDRREKELADLGFMPLIHQKNSDFAAFIGAQSLQEPTEYDDPVATSNAQLAARLPYLFASCRFAHYLKCIVRDHIGTAKTRQATEEWLKDWIMQYVDGNPDTSSEEVKARKPLAEANVTVEEDPENPGYYSSVFHLKPHYQLEGLKVSLRLVSKLPSE